MRYWLARLQAYLSCQPTEGNIVADLTALQAIKDKLTADIDTKLAADKAALDAANAASAAKDATIADLTAQLAAANTDQAGVDAVTAALTAADAKLAP